MVPFYYEFTLFVFLAFLICINVSPPDGLPTFLALGGPNLVETSHHDLLLFWAQIQIISFLKKVGLPCFAVEFLANKLLSIYDMCETFLTSIQFLTVEVLQEESAHDQKK